MKTKNKFIEGKVVCEQAEWNKLSDTQKNFLREAEDGHFQYLIEDGNVYAWGAFDTGNLFSMEVKEERTADGSKYFPV